MTTLSIWLGILTVAAPLQAGDTCVLTGGLRIMRAGAKPIAVTVVGELMASGPE